MRQFGIIVSAGLFLSACALVPREDPLALNGGAIQFRAPSGYCLVSDALSRARSASFALYTDCQEKPQAAVSVSIIANAGEGIVDSGKMGEKIAPNLYRKPHQGPPMPFTNSKTIYRTGMNAGEFAALITYYSLEDDRDRAQKTLRRFSRALKRGAP